MLSTLLEIQRLKRLERTGWTLRGQPPGTESVAAHSFGVAVVAMLLADEIRARGVEIDTERILRLAVMHDWAEARLGDMPRTGGEYFGAEARKRAERGAFDDIVRGLGTQIEKSYSQLHEDYEQRASLEARLVKAADVIDLLVQALAFERAGVRGLDEFWEGMGERYFQLEGVAGEVVADILRLLLDAHMEVTRKR
jgi:putative hydrolases of HD superfamily